MRFALDALALAWPVVLTIGLVVASSSWGWLTAALIYFLLFAVVSAVGMARSETLTWDQPIRLWLLTNLPGTFLILAFLPRQIRAVGPMVLVFMIAAVGGSTLWHNVFEVSPRLMLPVVDFFGSLGFSDMQAVSAVTYAFQLFGALMLALTGWMLLRGGRQSLRFALDQRPIGHCRLVVVLVRTNERNRLRLLRPTLVPGSLSGFRDLQDHFGFGLRHPPRTACRHGV
jgi:hypothetical protein